MCEQSPDYGCDFAALTALVFSRKDGSDLKTEMKESNAALGADLKQSIIDLRTEVRKGRAQVNTRFEQIEVRMDKMQADTKTFAVGRLSTISVLRHLKLQQKLDRDCNAR